MLKAFLNARIRKMERTWTYDASYLHEIIAASPMSAARFGVLSGLANRRDAPAEALAAVGVVGALAEDCGPCTQISVDMAAASGVKPAVLRAILAGDEQAMGANAALGYRFARTALERRLEEADAVREAVVRRWGQKGLVALALTLTTARMYPTVKYAMGHGKTCSRVTVAGETAPHQAPAMIAA
jgi:hypothetical protein